MRSLVRLIPCRVALALVGAAFGCGGERSRDVELAVPADEFPLPEVRVIALETGKNVSLEAARFDLRAYLTRARRDGVDAARAHSSPAFYPAPRGYAWFAIDPSARVAVTQVVSAEPLALGCVDDGFGVSLRDFTILGEEDADGRRAIRMVILHGRERAFHALLERAQGGQLLFVIPGRVLLAIEITAPVDGEFWLLDLPPHGESSFVDRLARAAN